MARNLRMPGAASLKQNRSDEHSGSQSRLSAPGSPTPADIADARQRLGWTQQQAAELLGVTRVTWARWEAGTPMPTYAWRYWLHVAGIERIPFRAIANRAGPRGHSITG